MLRIIILISAATALLLAVSAREAHSVYNFQSLMAEDGESSIAAAFENENQTLQEDGFIEDVFAKIVGFFNTIFPSNGANNGTFTLQFGNDAKSNTRNTDNVQVEKRDASKLAPPKSVYKIEKQTKEDTEMRDKLLNFVQKDPTEAFDKLNELRKYTADMAKAGSKKFEKRDTFELNAPISGYKTDKQKKEDTEMRSKLMNFAQTNPSGAFDMLTELKQDKVDADKADSKKIQIHDASEVATPKYIYKIEKDTKEDTEMRDKLLNFVQKDPTEAFDKFNELRKYKVDMAKTGSKKIQKRDASEVATPKSVYKIEKKTKEDTEMRDKLIDFVQADPEGVFDMLIELRDNRVSIKKSNSNQVGKREVFETASLGSSSTTGTKVNTPAKKDAEIREKLLSFILNNPSGAFGALNKLKEDRAKAQASRKIFRMKRDNTIPSDENNDDIYYEYIEENDI